jgi:long-chain fatty acid transport protein
VLKEEVILRFVRVVTLLSALLLVSSTGFAAGFSLFEQGAKATGMGGAFAATADDPSAVFYNVAGLAYQRDMAASVGSTLITFSNEFQGSDPFPGSDTQSAYVDHAFVVPNMYVTIPIGENATFAIGQFTPFGLRTDWDNGNTYSGRFISQDANIKTTSIQPSFAWKTSDGRFAVGAGVEYRLGWIALERNTPEINPYTQRVVDIAHVRLESDWSDGLGWNVGMMYRPNEDWSLGVNYRAEMDIDYTGDATFTQVLTGYPQFDAAVRAQLPPNQGLKSTISFPGFLQVGLATKLIDTWTIEADVVRTSWSSFEDLSVEFEQTPAKNINIHEGWSDAMSYRLGANKEINERWDARLGALYDESPQPLGGAGPLLPDADRIGVNFGLGYQGKHWSVDVTEFFLIFNDRDTRDFNRDNYNGIYKTTANLLSLNLGYTF